MPDITIALTDSEVAELRRLPRDNVITIALTDDEVADLRRLPRDNVGTMTARIIDALPPAPVALTIDVPHDLTAARLLDGGRPYTTYQAMYLSEDEAAILNAAVAALRAREEAS